LSGEILSDTIVDILRETAGRGRVRKGERERRAKGREWNLISEYSRGDTATNLHIDSIPLRADRTSERRGVSGKNNLYSRDRRRSSEISWVSHAAFIRQRRLLRRWVDWRRRKVSPIGARVVNHRWSVIVTSSRIHHSSALIKPSASSNGGVIYNNQESHHWTITSTHFHSNLALDSGGVIFNTLNNHDWIIISSTFISNTASYGGAITSEQNNHHWILISTNFSLNVGGSGGVFYNKQDNHDWSLVSSPLSSYRILLSHMVVVSSIMNKIIMIGY
jgi:predicted outer membrane repeat protein